MLTRAVVGVITISALSVFPATASAAGGGAGQDPTQAFESPFPIGTGATLSFNGSSGSATLGLAQQLPAAGLMLQAGILGQAGGSGPSGGLKVGFGYDSAVPALLRDSRAEGDAAGVEVACAQVALHYFTACEGGAVPSGATFPSPRTCMDHYERLQATEHVAPGNPPAWCPAEKALIDSWNSSTGDSAAQKNFLFGCAKLAADPSIKPALMCSEPAESQFPGITHVHGDSAPVTSLPAATWTLFFNIIPALDPVSYVGSSGGALDLSKKPATAYLFPTLGTLDFMLRLGGGRYLVGAEVGSGLILPQSVAKTGTYCTNVLLPNSPAGKAPQTTSSLQTCTGGAVTTAAPAYGQTAFANLGIVVNPIDIGTAYLPGIEFIAGLQTVSDPSAKAQVSLLSRAGNSASFALPVFLSKAGSAWAILGGVAPQLTVPFDGTPVRPGIAFFVGSGIFGPGTASGPATSGTKGS